MGHEGGALINGISALVGGDMRETISLCHLVANQEEDENSVLNFYRKAIALRKSLDCVRYGSYKEYFAGSGKLFCYEREYEGQKVLVLCSFTDKEQKLRIPNSFDRSKATLALQNYSELKKDLLQPYECRVYVIQ